MSDIAQISEVILGSDGNTESFPSSVTIESYLGPEGDRGAYIIPGMGNPSTYDFADAYFIDSTGNRQSITPQVFDWFVNLDSTDQDYRAMYLLNKDNEWQDIFKSMPNIYNTNRVVSFSNGEVVGLVPITVSAETLRIDQLFGDPNSVGGQSDTSIYRIPGMSGDVIGYVGSEEAMLSMGAPKLAYMWRADQLAFYRLVGDDSSDIKSWQKELSLNVSVDIQAMPGQTLRPMTIGLACMPPLYGVLYNSYLFRFTLKATEYASGIGFVPLTGQKIASISIAIVKD